MEQNKEALLELTKHFIELINVDIDEKGRIRKKTIAELVEMYIDYHSANCNLIEPKTVIDCLVSSVICIGMVVALNRPMRNLGHPMRTSGRYPNKRRKRPRFKLRYLRTTAKTIKSNPA